MFINISIFSYKGVFRKQNPNIPLINMSTPTIARTVFSNSRNFPVREETFPATKIASTPFDFGSKSQKMFFTKTANPFKFIGNSFVPSMVSFFKSHVTSINHITKAVNQLDKWFDWKPDGIVQRLMPI